MLPTEAKAPSGRSRTPELRFRARIEIVGVNPYVPVSADGAAKIAPGRRGPIPVLVRVNGVPPVAHRVNLMPTRPAGYRLYLNGVIRSASATETGQVVDVWVAFDPEYRSGPAHPMPRSFRDGLRAGAVARRTWAALSPSRKKEVLRYFASVRSLGARARNVALALRVLAGSTERFLGRTWTDDVPGAQRAAHGASPSAQGRRRLGAGRRGARRAPRRSSRSLV